MTDPSSAERKQTDKERKSEEEAKARKSRNLGIGCAVIVGAALLTIAILEIHDSDYGQHDIPRPRSHPSVVGTPEPFRSWATDSGSLAYKLAVIEHKGPAPDATVQHFRQLLSRLSTLYAEDDQQVSDMTVSAQQRLGEAGIHEELSSIMEGLASVLPGVMLDDDGVNKQRYAEY